MDLTARARVMAYICMCWSLPLSFCVETLIEQLTQLSNQNKGSKGSIKETGVASYDKHILRMKSFVYWLTQSIVAVFNGLEGSGFVSHAVHGAAQAMCSSRGRHEVRGDHARCSYRTRRRRGSYRTLGWKKMFHSRSSRPTCECSLQLRKIQSLQLQLDNTADLFSIHILPTFVDVLWRCRLDERRGCQTRYLPDSEKVRDKEVPPSPMPISGDNAEVIRQYCTQDSAFSLLKQACHDLGGLVCTTDILLSFC